MNTIDLRPTQPAVVAVAPRPKTAAAGVAATAPVCSGTAKHGMAKYGTATAGITGNGIVGSWLATSRLSLTVPAFHDRRPLCST